MTAELCRNCKFGKITGGSEYRINIGPVGPIPLGFVVPPRIERDCLNFIDKIIRRKTNVHLYAPCVKLGKYSPKTLKEN